MVRTINTVEVNTGLLTSQNTPVILRGQITEALWTNDFKNLLVVGRYFYKDEDEKDVLVKHFKRDLNETDINSLYASLEPIEGDKTEVELNIFDQAFLILMSQEYGINASNLELYYE